MRPFRPASRRSVSSPTAGCASSILRRHTRTSTVVRRPRPDRPPGCRAASGRPGPGARRGSPRGRGLLRLPSGLGLPEPCRSAGVSGDRDSGGGGRRAVSPSASLAETLDLFPPLVRDPSPARRRGRAAAPRRLRRCEPRGLSGGGAGHDALDRGSLFSLRLLLAAGYVGPYPAFFLPLPLVVAFAGFFALADRAAPALGAALPRLTAAALAVFVLFRVASVALLYRGRPWFRVDTPVGSLRLTEPVAGTTRDALEDLPAAPARARHARRVSRDGVLQLNASGRRSPFWLDQFFPGHLDETGRGARDRRPREPSSGRAPLRQRARGRGRRPRLRPRLHRAPRRRGAGALSAGRRLRPRGAGSGARSETRSFFIEVLVPRETAREAGPGRLVRFALSRRVARDAVRSGRIEVDGAVVDEPGAAVEPEARLDFHRDRPARRRVRTRLTVLHEDSLVLVVDKPAGLLTVPTEAREKDTLWSGARSTTFSTGTAAARMPASSTASTRTPRERSSSRAAARLCMRFRRVSASTRSSASTWPWSRAAAGCRHAGRGPRPGTGPAPRDRPARPGRPPGGHAIPDARALRGPRSSRCAPRPDARTRSAFTSRRRAIRSSATACTAGRSSRRPARSSPPDAARPKAGVPAPRIPAGPCRPSLRSPRTSQGPAPCGPEEAARQSRAAKEHRKTRYARTTTTTRRFWERPSRVLLDSTGSAHRTNRRHRFSATPCLFRYRRTARRGPHPAGG